jgi:hypothetical protein
MSIFSEVRSILVNKGRVQGGTKIKYTDPDTGEYAKIELGAVCLSLTPEDIRETALKYGITGKTGVRLPVGSLVEDKVNLGEGDEGTKEEREEAVKVVDLLTGATAPQPDEEEEETV